MTPPAGRPKIRSEYDEIIDRTQEYESFMEQLAEFNIKRGNVLQREPVLGGKRLDLYKIYRWVVESGGFFNVTSTRGWRHIAETFNLPATCTNSAYILKQIYRRNLLAWELKENPHLANKNVHSENSMPHSDEGFQYRGEPVAQSTKQDTQHFQDHDAYKNPTNYCALPRDPPNIPDNPAQIPDEYFGHNETPNIQNQRYNVQGDIMGSGISPYYNGPIWGEDDYLLGGGFKNRITLSLISQLPNEVDWAMNTLSVISYTKHFRLSALPGLIEALIEIQAPLLSEFVLQRETQYGKETLTAVRKTSSNVYGLGLGESGLEMAVFPISGKEERNREYFLMTMHTLRNVSFLPENAEFIALNYKLMEYIALCAAFKSQSFYIQAKNYALDILSNVTAYSSEISNIQDIVHILLDCVSTNDEGIIISALESLANIISKSKLKYLESEIDKTRGLILRCIEFLESDSNDLLLHALDILYEYSYLGQDCVDLTYSISAPNVLLKKLWIILVNNLKPIQQDNGTRNIDTGEAHVCKWRINHQNTSEIKICGIKFDTPDSVFQHIQKVHMADAFLRRDFYMSQPLKLFINECGCSWGGCTWKLSEVSNEFNGTTNWPSDSTKMYYSIIWKLIIHIASHFTSTSENQIPKTNYGTNVHKYHRDQSRNPSVDDSHSLIAKVIIMLIYNLVRLTRDKSSILFLEGEMMNVMMSDYPISNEIPKILAEL